MRKPKVQASGPGRIRLIVLEAEIPDGDLSQVTQAVQNALRPIDGAGTVRRALSGPSKFRPASTQDDLATEPDEVEELIDDVESSEAADAQPQKHKRSRVSWKPRSPNVIDVDLKSGDMPFVDFAAQKKPDSHNMKNLVVAAWFKQYRNLDAITMDHVYTCYRAVGWPSGMADFGITLRGLKKVKLMESKGRAQYAINHIGMSKVEDLGRNERP